MFLYLLSWKGLRSNNLYSSALRPLEILCASPHEMNFSGLGEVPTLSSYWTFAPNSLQIGHPPELPYIHVSPTGCKQLLEFNKYLTADLQSHPQLSGNFNWQCWVDPICLLWGTVLITNLVASVDENISLFQLLCVSYTHTLFSFLSLCHTEFWNLEEEVYCGEIHVSF